MAVSTSATARRTRDGTVISPTPGRSMTMVPTRAKVKRKAAVIAGRKETSICMKLAGGDAGRDAQHLRMQLFGHERQRDEKCDENRQNLRHKRDGHFLYLCQRL